MPSFPGSMSAQVIYRIIKELQEPVDLFNSSLTCRCIREHAERVLYARISLVSHGDRMKPLVLTCLGNRRHAARVRSLAAYSISTDVENANNPPVYGYNLLDNAIPYLTGIESLAIDVPNPAYFARPNLRDATQYGFLKSLTHVFIEQYRQPQGVDFLVEFVKLKSVKELRVNFLKDRSHGPSGRSIISKFHQGSTLAVLELTWCNLHSRTLKRLLRFCCCLKVFRYQHMNGEGYHAFDSDAFGRALLNTKNTLEELCIGVDIHDAPGDNEDSDDEETQDSDGETQDSDEETQDSDEEGDSETAKSDSGDEEVECNDEERGNNVADTGSGDEETDDEDPDLDDWQMQLGTIKHLTSMKALKCLRVPNYLLPKLIPGEPLNNLWVICLPPNLESLTVEGCDYGVKHIKYQLTDLLCKKELHLELPILKEVVLTDRETPWDCVKSTTGEPFSGPTWIEDAICIRPVDLTRRPGLRERLTAPKCRCEWVLSYFDDWLLMPMMKTSAIDFRILIDPVGQRSRLLLG